MNPTKTQLPPRDHNGPPQLLDDYFTVAELARQLGRCTRTLDRWATLRCGPPITTIGNTRLYKKESVYLWLASREQKSVREVAKSPRPRSVRIG
jgi:hypothetical protein